MEKSTHFVMQCVEKNKLDAGIDFVIQPIFDLSRFVCIGGEVLVRGTHRRHVVPPHLFIGELEKNGGIVSMGDYIMARAFRYISSQTPEVRDKQLFTLNISWIQLQDIHFATRALTLLSEYKLTPRHIVFEITDSGEPNDTVSKNLGLLREAGINLAWDGIDCLEKLQSRLALSMPDYVKLDRSCLNADKLEHTFTMLEHLKQWDIDVIIEGIENYVHVSTMLRHGVQYGQGFLFSRPVSKEAFHQQYMQPERA
ncbi:EAL domain-containing protein [Enterobacter huaxiensis]|jgi:EAL domain-containing protein (putative c-di-GMP-specific phosphodiesterase class I)|uniref:EAL domain-containing protein n=1 Tax=Enterobacter huaxiensis TaxID=2494702 RepID=UPI000E7253AE|nr:EAL domain-containing protein [Enterobacter huaxiensis]UNC52078.1 EAL domain-containing protein [Enterobacter huaxiensis]